MAKIDTSKIEGFDKMTADEKVSALEAYIFPDPDYSGYVKKDVYDKTASDLADWKKKHNALLSEEEQKKQAQAEQYEAMQKELAELKRGKSIADQKAKLIGIGYAEDLAEDTAVAMLDGDFDKVLANQKTYADTISKTTLAKTMQNSPTPPAGQPGAAGGDLNKRIREAQLRGDYAGAVSLMRLAQEGESMHLK